MNESNLGPLSQWVLLNRNLKIYQWSILGLIVVCFTMTVALIVQQFQDQIVVTEKIGGQRSYTTGSRTSVNPSNEDVEFYVRDFLNLRYNFSSKQLDTMAKNLAPVATESYVKACLEMLQRDLQVSQTDEVTQGVSGIRVKVTGKEVKANFDKIVRFKGVPIVVPSEVSLQIITGSANRWNPMGLYVNGVVENEGR